MEGFFGPECMAMWKEQPFLPKKASVPEDVDKVSLSIETKRTATAPPPFLCVHMLRHANVFTSSIYQNSRAALRC